MDSMPVCQLWSTSVRVRDLALGLRNLCLTDQILGQAGYLGILECQTSLDLHFSTSVVSPGRVEDCNMKLE